MPIADLRLSTFTSVPEALGAPVTHESRPAVIVLDGCEAISAVEQGVELRRMIGAPLLALVSHYEAAERALLLGADDVVVAPWAPAELRMRMRKLLRRPTPAVLRAGDLAISLGTRHVRCWAENIPLTPLEFDLLAHLVRSADRVVTYDELLDNVWGYDHEAGTRELVKSGVKRLRRKLGDSAAEPRYIGTVRGAGYRWLSPPASARRASGS